MSRGRIYLLIAAILGLVSWYLLQPHPTSKESAKVTTNSETKESVTSIESSPNQAPEKNSITSGSDSSTTAGAPLLGIDKELRECLQDEDWTRLLNSEYTSLRALSEDLVRLLKPIEVDMLVYKERTLKLASGEIKFIRFEISASGNEEGNQLYWGSMDPEGFPIPEDLPNEIIDNTEKSFEKLSSYGELIKQVETRLIRFTNETELSVVSSQQQVSSISVQTLEHQITCTLDSTKAYTCDCTY